MMPRVALGRVLAAGLLVAALTLGARAGVFAQERSPLPYLPLYSELTPYSNAELGFAAIFRGKPRLSRFPCEGCNALQETISVASQAEKASYAVGIFVFADGALKDRDPNELLTITLNSNLKVDKGREQRRGPTTLAGQPALEVEYLPTSRARLSACTAPLPCVATVYSS